MIATAVALAERCPLPDAVTSAAIRYLVGRTDQSLRQHTARQTAEFAQAMRQFSIAEHTGAANAQHYEVPAAFFEQVLGPHRKYSSCYYEPGDDLGAAEARALELTCRHAGLQDGQRILELGCGWGSLTLWMAERYPGSRITAISNSHTQRAYIESALARRRLTNANVITADINAFAPGAVFDRVVSVEMFEHLSNWREILLRLKTWLAADGRLFLHVFAHDVAPYRFDHGDAADFIAQHFFTGGIMPSHALIGEFGDTFTVEDEWRWSGEHYARTARDWLASFDRNRAAIEEIFRDVYGADARLWMRRWRLFFLATAGLFGYRGGSPWGVSHYRLRPTP
jgi:cyclopropane-fatty-acyl-phospholipid synthase